MTPGDFSGLRKQHSPGREGYGAEDARCFEFFEISQHLEKIIVVGRCEQLFKMWHISPPELKIEFFKGNQSIKNSQMLFLL